MKKTLLSILPIFVLALTAVAAPAPKAKPLAATLNIVINQPSIVAGVQLVPGAYQVVVAGGTASFERDGKEFCKAAVHTARSMQTFAANELVFDSSLTLKRIHLEGSNETLVFDQVTE